MSMKCVFKETKNNIWNFNVRRVLYFKLRMFLACPNCICKGVNRVYRCQISYDYVTDLLFTLFPGKQSSNFEIHLSPF